MKLAACQRFDLETTPRDWTIEPIKKRIRLEYGSGLTEENRRDGLYPVFGSNGCVGKHDKYLVEGPGILVGRKGSIGEVHYSESAFWPIDTVYYVCRVGEADWDYCYYLLDFLNLGRLNAATGLPGLTRRDAHDILGAFPDIDEQRRIAAALKLADDAIDTARTELDASRELKRSLMKILFSEGLARHHGAWQETKLGRIPASWRITRVKDILVGRPTNGVSPQSNPEPPGIKILNVSCIRNGECDTGKVTYVDLDRFSVESLQVHQGDFFVLRGNGNRDFIGIGGVIRDDIDEPIIYSDLLFRLKFRETETVPLFVPYLWQTNAFLNRLQAKAKSGSGLWKIGKRDIENELLALPTKEEQRDIVSVIDSAISACNAAAQKVETLQSIKRSLLQNLLTGKIRIPEGAFDV